MTKILAGQKAPEINLSGIEGKRYSLSETLKKGPVVAAFFKISCPVCQFTFPFLERMHEAGQDSRVTFWAVSQDNPRDTKAFLDEFGIHFPALIDAQGYPASNAYGLTNVPTIFLIAPDGKVSVSSVGFVKADLEKIAAEVSRANGKPAAPLFRPEEKVPAQKPG